MSRWSDRLAGSAGGLTILLVGFLIGVVGSARLGWLQPMAELELHNAGIETLSNLELRVQTAGLESVTALPEVSPGARIKLRFHVAGEGGYQLRRQGSPKVLRNDYVEAGDRIAVTLP